jgi:hypothetical protein
MGVLRIRPVVHPQASHLSAISDGHPGEDGDAVIASFVLCGGISVSLGSVANGKCRGGRV